MKRDSDWDRERIRGSKGNASCRAARPRAEATNVRIECLRLLHVADVSRVRDDRKLGTRNGPVQLVRDADRAPAIVVTPQRWLSWSSAQLEQWVIEHGGDVVAHPPETWFKDLG